MDDFGREEIIGILERIVSIQVSMKNLLDSDYTQPINEQLACVTNDIDLVLADLRDARRIVHKKELASE